jgi:hypothetical protein
MSETVTNRSIDRDFLPISLIYCSQRADQQVGPLLWRPEQEQSSATDLGGRGD